MPPPQPSDHFTRFTSTSPHASSKPSSSSASPSSSQFTSRSPRPNAFTSSNLRTTPSSSSSSAPAPPQNGETPKEKVARLRAAARAAKSRSQMSLVDRIIDRGRVWADFSHRVVAYGLIGFTGIAAAVSLYGVTSLITHNRRQKRAWIDREMQRLGDAHAAFLRGEATPEQLHVLEQERAGMELETQKERQKKLKKEQGVWASLKGFAGSLGGSKGDEEEDVTDGVRRGPERLLEEGWVEGEIAASAATSSSIPSNVKNSVTDAVKEFDQSRRQGEKAVEAVTGLKGGPLDAMASNLADALTLKREGGSSSWLGWVRGGGKS